MRTLDALSGDRVEQFLSRQRGLARDVPRSYELDAALPREVSHTAHRPLATARAARVMCTARVAVPPPLGHPPENVRGLKAKKRGIRTDFPRFDREILTFRLRPLGEVGALAKGYNS